jgi:hypothetical protein
MIKLYQLSTPKRNKYYCFAPNKNVAQSIIIQEIFGGKKLNLDIVDITKIKINEDGVKYLIDKNFIGIPKRKMFMLHGSEIARDSHYNTKGHTSELWYSLTVPGSEEIWK